MTDLAALFKKAAKEVGLGVFVELFFEMFIPVLVPGSIISAIRDVFSVLSIQGAAKWCDGDSREGVIDCRVDS